MKPENTTPQNSRQNKIWQKHDPIGFELELLENSDIPLEINPQDLITPENIDSLFDKNGSPIIKEEK